MRVIFVIVSMAGGGAERVISILANRFVAQGIGVTIMMTAGAAVDYQLDQRVALAVMGGTSGGSLKKRWERIRRMRRVFKEQPDAVIISFGPGTSFFAVAAAVLLPNPFVISERNDPAACEHPHLRNLIYTRAAEMIFQTEAAARCFPNRLQRRGQVIGNPISSDLPPAYQGQREKKIMAVGRLEPQKNYACLLEAFARFSQASSPAALAADYTLHIYGSGSLQAELQRQAKQLGIDRKVVWEGFRKDVTEQIKTGAMYVLPSDYEGISNALLEAMALGMPVIATDCPIGGAAMCIRNRENGLLVPVRDKLALAQAMEELASQPEWAAQLGQAAAGIRKEYSEENIVAQWLVVLRKAAQTNHQQ